MLRLRPLALAWPSVEKVFRLPAANLSAPGASACTGIAAATSTAKRRWARNFIRLRKQLVHHVSIYIREPEIAAGVAVSQLLVIEPQRVQQGGMQVVHVDLVHHSMMAKLIGLAVREAGFEAAAGEPDAEAGGVVIAARAVALGV